MRFNEFDTHNNLETKLKHFFEGKISSKDFSSYIKENQITEADLLENPLGALFKNAPKLKNIWDRFGKAFRRGANPKQGELPLKGGSNTRPSAPSAAPKPGSSTAGKVAGGAALGAAGTAAVLGTGGAPGPDQATSAQPNRTLAKGLPPGTAAPKVPEPKPSGNMDDSSFGKAFAAARKQHGGPGGKFTWRGKEYQTNVKGEKYAKNPTAVSFGAPKPAAPSTPQQTGGAGGEFATSNPAAPKPQAAVGGDDSGKIMFRDKEYTRGELENTRGELEKKLQAARAKRDALIAQRDGQGYT